MGAGAGSGAKAAIGLVRMLTDPDKRKVKEPQGDDFTIAYPLETLWIGVLLIVPTVILNLIIGFGLLNDGPQRKLFPAVYILGGILAVFYLMGLIAVVYPFAFKVVVNETSMTGKYLQRRRRSLNFSEIAKAEIREKTWGYYKLRESKLLIYKQDTNGKYPEKAFLKIDMVMIGAVRLSEILVAKGLLLQDEAPTNSDA